ncbi:hypothetical protein BDZ89DRAFT_1050144 [Hymenopellis radicata]|nr:hypothetical protein BDZ89DRAFT_1050144 [Hymenopellis radicata]
MSPNPYWTSALPPASPSPASNTKHGPFSPPYWPTDVKPASWPYPYQYPGWCNYGYQQSLLSIPVPGYARLTPANAPYFNWPIYLPCSSYTYPSGPTLRDLHKELHRPVPQSELDVLPKWSRDAVCNAFWARVQRVGGSAYSEGLKRVDFLAGKTTFKGVRLDGA